MLQRTRGRNPSYPELQPARTLHDGGQIRRVGGHIGRYEKKGSAGDGDVCTVGSGTAARQPWWPCWWKERSGQRTVPVQSLRGTATQRQDETSPAIVSKPSAACHTWALLAEDLSRRSHLDPPASANSCSQFLTDWKRGAGSPSMPSIMASAMVGWRFLTMLCCLPHSPNGQQLWAARHWSNPILPWTMGRVRGPSLTLALLECQKWRGGTPILDHHVSQRMPNCPQVVPCAIRNWPLSLRTSATANAPGCLRRGGCSGTTQPVLLQVLAESRVIGAPNTLIPCASKGNVSPLHTKASGFTARAALVIASMPSGNLTASVPHLGLALVQTDVCVT